MLERTIVEKFSEPMAMDTYKGLRLRAAVIPPLAKALTLIHKSWRRKMGREMNAFQGVHDTHPSFP